MSTLHVYYIDGQSREWEEVQKFIFDETSAHWSYNAEMNRTFLRAHENYMNHKLAARGFVFLNEVLESIGLERTSLGQLLGWEREGGQGYISFGLDEVDPYESKIELTFKVDGMIWNKIDQLKVSQ